MGLSLPEVITTYNLEKLYRQWLSAIDALLTVVRALVNFKKKAT